MDRQPSTGPALSSQEAGCHWGPVMGLQDSGDSRKLMARLTLPSGRTHGGSTPLEPAREGLAWERTGAQASLPHRPVTSHRLEPSQRRVRVRGAGGGAPCGRWLRPGPSAPHQLGRTAPPRTHARCPPTRPCQLRAGESGNSLTDSSAWPGLSQEQRSTPPSSLRISSDRP